MPNLNKVMVMGIVGRNPDIKTFDNGNSIATMSVATSEHWKDKNTGERKERTEWVRILVQGGLLKVAKDYIKKGTKVYIEGSWNTRKWTDQKGVEREVVEVKAKEIQLL